MSETWQTGTIKFFDDARGYGFIRMPDGEDCFVHARALPEGLDYLHKGTEVEFVIGHDRQGRSRATRVRLA